PTAGTSSNSFQNEREPRLSAVDAQASTTYSGITRRNDCVLSWFERSAAACRRRSSDDYSVCNDQQRGATSFAQNQLSAAGQSCRLRQNTLRLTAEPNTNL